VTARQNEKNANPQSEGFELRSEEGGMRKIGTAALLLAAGVSAAMSCPPAEAARERLFYETVESMPGGKSQGWRGTLYDKEGLAMTIEPGLTAKTPAGTFVSIACAMPWTPCGMIPAVMLRGTDLDRAENFIMDEKWSYRLYVVSSGSKSEGVRGELVRDEDIVKPEPNREIKTPMGVFVWADGPNPSGMHGWVPQVR
jgi:hypothetical protein